MSILIRSTVAVAAITALAVSAGSDIVRPPSNPTHASSNVSLTEMKHHLESFEDIAEEHDGNRAAGTGGYDASVDYVADRLSDAGFDVTLQTCESCENSGDVNVIADWPGGDEDATILAGAHLDGVEAGPGSNDNASGSAALLQVALTVAKADPDLERHLRFAWWAEEEAGLHGSQYYVDSIGVSKLDAYVNLDMVASPNAGYFVDNMTQDQSASIAEALNDDGLPPAEMTACCSDDISFSEAGLPTTTLSAGYSDAKTPDQADAWGGTSGAPFDPCIHTACDAYPGNIDPTALNALADAAAIGLIDLAGR
ncbi:M20/M25/M40 family metallo-hydrolase [Stackebrandtia soli]|uniref:M20/M25/M40 family metallo-hydrolase n=1 Tax=Stackebrandtia soli TaxID=1892856 RepID=UPI0039E96589